MSDFGHDRVNVLLVDDSTFARGVAHRVLKHAGIETVLEARSGQEALDLLDPARQAVDIIFCDLMMPRLDGVQLIRCLALLETPPAIVFLSGANAALLKTVEDTARARGLRVLGIIEKPLTADAVHRVIARLGDKLPLGSRSNSASVNPEDVELALANEQFSLHFQPKVAMSDGKVVGFESLARWFHPERGVIPPSSFIPVAERSGQIGALTDRLTRLALEQSAAWASVRLLTKISVNLSAYMLVDLDLPDRMASDAARFRIDPGRVIFEITESGLLQDSANTLDILARLHMKGFPLSIDDFGTGYSSMEQLRRIPFAEMKIDRIFVNGASENPRARAILESSANLGRSLQMSVVAEGVETQEDWDTARAAGVDIVQGYFVAKPMAAMDVRPWLTNPERKRAGIVSNAAPL